MVAQFNIFKPPDLIQFQVAADSGPAPPRCDAHSVCAGYPCGQQVTGSEC